MKRLWVPAAGLLLALPSAAQGGATVYCTSTPNSTGAIASLAHFGSLDLAQTSFGLTSTGLPPTPTSFGVFTCGTVPTDVPFGNGTLCISPFAPGITKMGVRPLGAGTASIGIPDTPGAFTQCTPGSTWYYQFWYRDPTAGGSRFNLSDGLQIVFAP